MTKLDGLEKFNVWVDRNRIKINRTEYNFNCFVDVVVGEVTGAFILVRVGAWA